MIVGFGRSLIVKNQFDDNPLMLPSVWFNLSLIIQIIKECLSWKADLSLNPEHFWKSCFLNSLYSIHCMCKICFNYMIIYEFQVFFLNKIYWKIFAIYLNFKTSQNTHKYKNRVKNLVLYQKLFLFVSYY